MKSTLKREKGFILVSILVVLPSLIMIAVLFMELTVNSLTVARKDQFQTHAQFGADAGIDMSLYEINQDHSWAGTSSPVEVHNDGTTKVTYDVVVTAVDADNKLLTVTGKTYNPVNAGTPRSTVSINTELRAVKAGDYSIVTGVGGLYMSNSAKILGGDVFVNGEISMQNGAQIGLTSSPANVDVAHQNCPSPANATYPRLCGSGENGQPITLQNNSKIYGSVQANNQTNGTGMSNPGLVSSSGVVAQALPPHDRAAQQAAVTSTISGASAGCSSGTKTWPANLKITGDVTVSGSCKVTVAGNVWITGKLTMRNSSQLIVADSLGATRPNIMVDDTGNKFDNSSLLKSNASGTGFQIVSYYSRASCSPDCPSVTGLDLFNSRNDTTIELDNSASGPNTIFYSKWTRVLISNGGQIGALIGQTVELKNSSTITFGTSVGTGDSYWIISGYRRNFPN